MKTFVFIPLRLRTQSFLCLAWFLAGCTSSVVKMGPDTYSVSSHMLDEAGGGGGARTSAIKRANSFCEELGREILVTQALVQGNEAGVTFRCLLAGDLELKRPVYEQAPTTVIQDRRE